MAADEASVKGSDLGSSSSGTWRKMAPAFCDSVNGLLLSVHHCCLLYAKACLTTPKEGKKMISLSVFNSNKDATQKKLAAI